MEKSKEDIKAAREEAKTILDGFKDIKSVKTSGVELKSGWSDKMFKETYGTLKFPELSDSQAITIATEWNKKFYASSLGQFDVSNLIYYAIACHPGMHETGVKNDKPETDFSELKTAAKKTAEYLASLQLEESKQTEDDDKVGTGSKLANLQTNKETNASFGEDYDEDDDDNYLISKWLENPTRYVRELRCVTSFQALVITRLIVKSVDSVARYFRDRFHTVFTQIFSKIPVPRAFAEPTSAFLMMVRINVQKGTTDCVQLLASLVNAYVQHNDTPTTRVRDALDAGCMLHMRGNGLGLVSLFVAVAARFKLTYRDLSSYIISMKTKTSIQRLHAHFSTMLPNDDITWWWARLIDDGYFSDLTIKENLYCCVLLASIIRDEQPDIFSLASFSGVSPTIRGTLEKRGNNLRALFLKEEDQDEYLGDKEDLLEMENRWNEKKISDGKADELTASEFE